MMLQLPAVASGAPTLDTIHHTDALTLLRALPAGSVDCVVTDPPYNGVKEDAWDNQWKTDADFLAWLRVHLVEFRRVLKPNGSLYLFASPRMAARVEVLVQEQFNILNSLIWYKTTGNRNWAADKEAVRSFLPNTERIVFAEQYGEDRYELASQRLFDEVFQIAALCRERGLGRAEIAPVIVEDYKSLESAKAQVSNWLLGKNIPNPIDFQRLKNLVPIVGEYEELRTRFEDLRQQYEPLRRPFNMDKSNQFMDVWNFAPVQSYPGKHPCEKPLEMMEHIIKASTRPGAVVLDCFCGSGATLDAARRLGRHFIGCDFSAEWAAAARKRVATPYMRPMWLDLPAVKPSKTIALPEQKPLFASVMP